MACPAPPTGPRIGQSCAGAGRCLDSTGVCDCFTGHIGTDCSLCSEGWSLSPAGFCILRVDGSLLALPEVTNTPTPSGGSTPGRNGSTNGTILGSGNGGGTPNPNVRNSSKHWGIGLGVGLGMAFGFPGFVIGALLVYVRFFKKKSTGTPRTVIQPVSEAEVAATVATPEEGAEQTRKARGKAKLPEYEEEDATLPTITESDHPHGEIVEIVNVAKKPTLS